MTIQEQLKQAYNLLPAGYKKRAAKIYGCSLVYFKNIIEGTVKDESAYHSALQAVKQAASEAKTSILKDIKQIEVIDQQEVKD